jgi:hypothetical protein
MPEMSWFAVRIQAASGTVLPGLASRQGLGHVAAQQKGGGQADEQAG